jgi:hypothetical protein
VVINMTQAEKIRHFLIKQAQRHPHDLVAFTAERFAVSRTTVLRHIRTLVDAGELIKTGTTKQVSYALADALEQVFTFNLDDMLDEFTLFSTYIAPVIKPLVNANCYDICEYTVTEIVNNAKDHSRGKSLKLSLDIGQDAVNFSCQDDGVGVFVNLQQALGFEDVRDTLLQLSKGKLTSDAVNHTGEGLFFTSRVNDEFRLITNNFCFLRDNRVNDWSFFQVDTKTGTLVNWVIQRQTKRCLADVFKAYQSDDSLQFSKTDVLVELAKEHGARLVSRSQAKRVAAQLELFQQITFDFKGVTIVGQGFVDQLFRVFQQQYPDIKLHYVNANDDVKYMIQRGVDSES